MPPRNAKAEIGQKRSYAVPGADGPVTSVTTYLKAYPKEFLAPWAAKMVAERAVNEAAEFARRSALDALDTIKWLKAAPWESRDAAAEHGSSVHDYLERRMRGGNDAPTTDGERAVDAFIDAYRPTPLYVEAQIANLESPTNPYAGSCDLIANIYGDDVLIDLKTSGTLDPSMQLQLAAYRYGEFIFEDERVIAPVPIVDYCAVLWVPRENPAGWQFIRVPASYEQFLVFSAVQQVYRFSQQKGIGGEIVLPQVEEVMQPDE